MYKYKKKSFYCKVFYVPLLKKEYMGNRRKEIQYQFDTFKMFEEHKVNLENRHLKIHEDRKWKLVTKNFRKFEDVK